MQPHQQRVIEEQTELDEKIMKLGAFIMAPAGEFEKLHIAERIRLMRQLSIMQLYSQVLEERIAAFGGVNG